MSQLTVGSLEEPRYTQFIGKLLPLSSDEKTASKDHGHHSNVSFKIVVSQTYESWLITGQEYENLMGPLAHMSNLVQCAALEAIA